jgi:hypothetical protein
LSLRSEPSAKAPRVGTIPAGTACLRSLGCRGGLDEGEYFRLAPEERARALAARPRWCRLEFQGLSGWADARYLAEGACDAAGRPLAGPSDPAHGRR